MTERNFSGLNRDEFGEGGSTRRDFLAISGRALELALIATGSFYIAEKVLACVRGVDDDQDFVSEKEKSLADFNSEVANISKEYGKFAAGMIYFFLDDVEKQGLLTKVEKMQDENDGLNFLNEVEFCLKEIELRMDDTMLVHNGVIERNGMRMTRDSLKSSFEAIDSLRKFFEKTQKLRIIYENPKDLSELLHAREAWRNSLLEAKQVRSVTTDTDRILKLRNMEEESEKLKKSPTNAKRGAGLRYPKDIKDPPTDLTDLERKF